MVGCARIGYMNPTKMPDFLRQKFPEIYGCETCAEQGQGGACAKTRCYCGHETCWAFDSYIRRSEITAPKQRKADKRMADSWAERDEPTWLDR